jgi:hypothetical protein
MIVGARPVHDEVLAADVSDISADACPLARASIVKGKSNPKSFSHREL